MLDCLKYMEVLQTRLNVKIELTAALEVHISESVRRLIREYGRVVLLLLVPGILAKIRISVLNGDPLAIVVEFQEGAASGGIEINLLFWESSVS